MTARNILVAFPRPVPRKENVSKHTPISKLQNGTVTNKQIRHDEAVRNSSNGNCCKHILHCDNALEIKQVRAIDVIYLVKAKL